MTTIVNHVMVRTSQTCSRLPSPAVNLLLYKRFLLFSSRLHIEWSPRREGKHSLQNPKRSTTLQNPCICARSMWQDPSKFSYQSYFHFTAAFACNLRVIKVPATTETNVFILRRLAPKRPAGMNAKRSLRSTRLDIVHTEKYYLLVEERKVQ